MLVGGDDISAQGWTTVSSTPNALTYGEDHVRFATSTASGERASGHLLLTRANAFDDTKPFTLCVTALVESVNTHNSRDSGVAIRAGFTGPFGSASMNSR
ncbi:MAG: hypothetical protein ABW123_14975 [Cystobacter sp.]